MENREQRETVEALLERVAEVLEREEDEILDVDGAAELLKASPATVREWARLKHIPARRVGRGGRAPWRFSKRALLLWARGSSGRDRR